VRAAARESSMGAILAERQTDADSIANRFTVLSSISRGQ